MSGGLSNMSKLKIALLQISDRGSIDGNLAAGLEVCEKARDLGADIALLPELWSHGYRLFDERDHQAAAGWRASALELNSAFVMEHARGARSLGMAIGCTLLAASPEGPSNSLVLIDRHGDLVLHYAKVHICQHTVERFCRPGDAFSVAALDMPLARSRWVP